MAVGTSTVCIIFALLGNVFIVEADAKLIQKTGASQTLGGDEEVGQCSTTGEFGEALQWNCGEDPFSVIWNVPSYVCQNMDTINMGEYEIKINNDDDHAWSGEVIHLFYKLGNVPQILEDGTYVNGGIPQLCNLSAHFEQVIIDLNEQLPDKSFSGLGVIDYKSFRVKWEQNFGAMAVYQSGSWLHVHSRRPELSDEETQALAKVEFESAARALFEGTLSILQSERPRALWTFHSYPYCFNTYQDNTRQCLPQHQDDNDQTQWLYQAMTAISPSTYMVDSGNPTDNIHQESYVYARTWEAMRLANKRYYTTNTNPASTFIYAMLWYYSGNMLYDFDFYPIIRVPADLGAAGVVLWGSSQWVNTPGKCDELVEFVERTVGPEVRRVVQDKRECAQGLCSGHGRCAADALRLTRAARVAAADPAAWSQLVGGRLRAWHAAPGKRQHWASSGERFAGYSCLCYPGWGGSACNVQLEPLPY